MPHVRIKGFVVREVPVGESDRIIGLLTEEQGLINVSARGVRRSRSPHLMTTQVFAYSEFELFQNKGHYSLNASELIEPYLQLQKDLDRLVCAAHLAEVLVDCMRDDIAQPALFRLWAYSMQAMQSSPDPLLAVHVAQWRMLAEIGLSPRLDSCVQCGRKQEQIHSFSISSCGLVCSRAECLSRTFDAVPLSPGAWSCLSYCQTAPLARLFNFTVMPDIRSMVIDLSSRYLVHQLEKPYTKLDMLKAIQPDTT